MGKIEKCNCKFLTGMFRKSVGFNDPREPMGNNEVNAQLLGKDDASVTYTLCTVEQNGWV